jgi:hypothetical protein
MSINYSAITTSKQKITLPSVDSWGANFQVLRDPPKSIHTRRIDKVGEGSGITQMIDDSGDRACEAILEYARGVNPMVSVSYSNNDGTPSKLPYTVNKDGAFRPPVVGPRDLMPLSRQPRNWTTAFTKPGFADYSKRLKDCGQMTDKNTREVKNCTIKTSIRPTAVFQLETPISEPFEVKYMIQNPVKTAVTSGLKTLDYTTQNVIEPVKGVDYNMMHAYAQSNINIDQYKNDSQFNPNRYLQDNLNTNAVSNISNPYIYVNETEFDPERFIQNNLNTDASTNPSLQIQVTPIEDIIDMANIRTQNTLHSSYNTPIKGLEQNNIYDHNDIELKRNVPEHYANTNINQNIHKKMEYDNSLQFERKMPIAVVRSNPGTRERNLNEEINSREYKLAQKVHPGGFDGRGSAPTMERQNNVYNLSSSKSNMNKRMTESFENRYQSITPRA